MNGINKTMMYLPKEIFENSVLLINVESKSDLYFDQEKLIESLNQYFDSQIPRYTKKYETHYTFTNPSDQSVCTSEKCQSVQVDLTAEIFSLTYFKKMYYSIGER